jgi:hypothetical protein
MPSSQHYKFKTYQFTEVLPKDQLSQYCDWLRENDLRTDRFVPVELNNGHKKPVESGWQSRSNQYSYWEIDGPKGIVTGDGLTVIDIDDAELAPTVLGGIPGLRVETMHLGEHIHVAIDGDLPESRSPTWGDVQTAEDLVIAPGTTFDHSDCVAECGRVGSATYSIIEAIDGTVDVEDYPSVFERADDAREHVTEIDPDDVASTFDGTRNGRLAYARNHDRKLRYLFLWACGKRSLAGFDYNDRSSAECALAQKLLWWYQWDVSTVRDVLDTIKPPKWTNRSERYRNSVIRAGLRYTAGENSKYEPDRMSGVCHRHALDVCVVLGIASNDGAVPTRAIIEHEFIDVGKDQVRKVLNALRDDGFIHYEEVGRSGHWVIDELPGSEHRFFDQFPTQADVDQQRRRWAVSE